MKLKVCGMKEITNIRALAEIKPDWMGMIFYDKSPRFPSNLTPQDIQSINIQKVGVFVKEKKEKIQELVSRWKLDYVQLHGDETVEEVKRLKEVGLKIIKVFRVSNKLSDDWGQYVPFVDYFLFDTKKAGAYGGTGEKFDWTLLKDYNGEVPYLLSGGVESNDIPAIKELKLAKCIGIDVNSKVEISPGLKDLKKIKNIKKQL